MSAPCLSAFPLSGRAKYVSSIAGAGVSAA
jgi:hypothetical protein